MVIERVIIRPVEGGEPLVLVIVTLGLLILLNSGAGWIWGFGNRSFPSLFGNDSIDVAGVRIDVESLGIVAVMLDRRRASSSCSRSGRSSGWPCGRWR